MSKILNSNLKFCLGVHMSKYLDLANAISLSVHRKPSENDMKKTEVLHNFFSSVFIGNHFLFKALNLSPGTGGRRIGRENQVRDHVRNMNIHKS